MLSSFRAAAGMVVHGGRQAAQKGVPAALGRLMRRGTPAAPAASTSLRQVLSGPPQQMGFSTMPSLFSMGGAKLAPTAADKDNKPYVSSFEERLNYISAEVAALKEARKRNEYLITAARNDADCDAKEVKSLEHDREIITCKLNTVGSQRTEAEANVDAWQKMVIGAAELGLGFVVPTSEDLDKYVVIAKARQQEALERFLTEKQDMLSNADDRDNVVAAIVGAFYKSLEKYGFDAEEYGSPLVDMIKNPLGGSKLEAYLKGDFSKAVTQEPWTQTTRTDSFGGRSVSNKGGFGILPQQRTLHTSAMRRGSDSSTLGESTNVVERALKQGQQLQALRKHVTAGIKETYGKTPFVISDPSVMKACLGDLLGGFRKEEFSPYAESVLVSDFRETLGEVKPDISDVQRSAAVKAFSGALKSIIYEELSGEYPDTIDFGGV